MSIAGIHIKATNKRNLCSLSYNKSKKDSGLNESEILRQKAEKYKQRMSPPIKEGIEVSKGLAKD